MAISSKQNLGIYLFEDKTGKERKANCTEGILLKYILFIWSQFIKEAISVYIIR